MSVSHQTLVSNILLRPHVTDTDATMLSRTSQIRAQVEEARVDLLKWIRKRWMGIRQEGGFDGLEGWSLKEISQGAVLLSKPRFLHIFIEHLHSSFSRHLQLACCNVRRDRSTSRRSYLPCTASHTS